MQGTTATQSSNGKPTPTAPQLTVFSLTTHPKTSTGKVVGGPPLPLPIHSELNKLGFDLARATLSQQPKPEDELTVENVCRATARQAFRQKFNPANDLHDREVQQENERNKVKRDKLDEQADFAAKAVRAAKHEKAQLAPAEKPSIPLTIMLLGAFLIATSLSPTFADYFFFSVSDTPLRWLYSIGAGALIGFVISWGALRYVDVKVGNNEPGWLNGFVIGAFLLALALGGIRLANATTATAVQFALALTGMELAVFLILEFLARRFRASFNEYQSRSDAHSKIDRQIEAASDHHSDVVQERTSKQAEIDGYFEYIEWRELCNTNIDRIEEAAVQAGLSGYRAGVAVNRSETILP